MSAIKYERIYYLNKIEEDLYTIENQILYKNKSVSYNYPVKIIYELNNYTNIQIKEDLSASYIILKTKQKIIQDDHGIKSINLTKENLNNKEIIIEPDIFVNISLMEKIKKIGIYEEVSYENKNEYLKLINDIYHAILYKNLDKKSNELKEIIQFISKTKDKIDLPKKFNEKANKILKELDEIIKENENKILKEKDEKIKENGEIDTTNILNKDFFSNYIIKSYKDKNLSNRLLKIFDFIGSIFNNEEKTKNEIEFNKKQSELIIEERDFAQLWGEPFEKLLNKIILLLEEMLKIKSRKIKDIKKE